MLTRSIIFVLFLLTNVAVLSQTLTPFEINGKWGYRSAEGEVIVAPKYDYVWEFDNGLAFVNIGGAPGFDGGIYDGLWGCIDQTGKEIIPTKYNYMSTFQNGFSIVSLKGKFGVIDTSGTVVIKTKYAMIQPSENGLFKVNLGMDYSSSGGHETINSYGKYGYLDSNGKVVIPIIYTNIGPFYSGLAAVQRNEKWGFMDASGKEIISPKYDHVTDFSHPLAIVSFEGGYDLIDKLGNTMTPSKFSFLEYTNVGTIAASEGSAINEFGFEHFYNWSILDSIGKSLTVSTYGYMEYQSYSSYAFVCNGCHQVEYGWMVGGKWGSISLIDGHEIIPLQYERLGSVSEELLWVKHNSKFGFIDFSGKIVVPIKYDAVNDFSNGYARVNIGATSTNDNSIAIGGKWGIIDNMGNEIVAPRYDYVYDFSSTDLLAHFNIGGHVSESGEIIGGKWGYINTNGTEVIPAIYDKASYFYGGQANVEVNGRSFNIDTAGNEIE